MKIAIINERADTSLGGAERSSFELTEALQQTGADSHLIAAIGRPSAADNIHILWPDRTERVNFASFRNALIEHLQKNHYDIIHSFLPFDFVDIYQPRGGSYPEAIIRNAASYQNKFVALLKMLSACANFRRTILQQAEKKLCQKNNGPIIAALSNYVAEQFKKYYNLDSQRIAVIPNGIKISKALDAAVIAKTRSQILGKFQDYKADKATLFLFVANNFRLKGLRPLIKSISSAIRKKSDNQIFLIVAGSDNPDKFKALTSKIGIEKQIQFVNYVPDINNLIEIADVAILPTFYDPSSRFILEAIAAGKPVITTKYNGASELLTNNRHCIIIDEPGDIEALADAIIYFTDKDNLRKASQTIAADNLKDKVSINRAARQLISLYETILDRKRV
jgi:UDP-glucose:(heptosyl)LPS alpha-1,3-glucosyltransferase